MIVLENVSKVYGTGSSALSDVSLTIEKGEFVFLMGASGAGKTTLLRLLIRDMLPTEGKIVVNNIDVVNLPNNKVPELRRRIGVVFQDLKLLTDRTIFENISLPLEMTSDRKEEIEQKVHQILEQVGIADHKHKFPVQLSGGELQRVAIARALVFSPDILLADEPTGNLDTGTSWEIVKILQDINKAGTTIVMATHNTDIMNNLLKRIITLEKGKITKDTKKETQPKADRPLDENGSKDKHKEKEETKNVNEPPAIHKEHEDKKEEKQKDREEDSKDEKHERIETKETNDKKENKKEKS
jgi:cell division transport system ATP-binding protein